MRLYTDNGKENGNCYVNRIYIGVSRQELSRPVRRAQDNFTSPVPSPTVVLVLTHLKGPCSYIVYTCGPNGFSYNYFRAKVCLI